MCRLCLLEFFQDTMCFVSSIFFSYVKYKKAFLGLFSGFKSSIEILNKKGHWIYEGKSENESFF